MKARVKETGEIVDVVLYSGYDDYDYICHENECVYDAEELEFNDPDYWERLKHQYAGMAMQGMIRIVGHDRMYPPEKMAIFAVACATALVEKLKSESNTEEREEHNNN